MSNGWIAHRTIVEESKASESLDNLRQEHERFESQWEGFSWLLARSPDLSRHKIVNDIEYRLMHRAGDDSCGLLGIAAVFTYDDNEVVLIDVNAWEEQVEPEEE